MNSVNSGQHVETDGEVEEELQSNGRILLVASQTNEPNSTARPAIVGTKEEEHQVSARAADGGGNTETVSLSKSTESRVKYSSQDSRASADVEDPLTHFPLYDLRKQNYPQPEAKSFPLAQQDGALHQVSPSHLRKRIHPMCDPHRQNRPNDEDEIEDQQSPRCRSSSSKWCSTCKKWCRTCPRRFRPPQWLTRGLMFLYRHLSAMTTYAIFVLAVYSTILSIMPNVALPPICRRVAVPEDNHKQIINGSTVTTTTTIVTESTDLNESPGYSLDPNYMEALECRRGAALSVIIYYAFGFVCGELMELLHLPGLLGMLVGGLALRNIGAFALPYRIFHEGLLPNGSYPLSQVGHNFPKHSDDNDLFPVRDYKVQLAALLVVNPELSGTLRQLALTTILTRAGLGIDPTTLRAVFGSVFRLAFIPCIAEAFTLMIVTRFLVGWPWAWGAILGFVCAAVSPAVIVPNMMRLEVTGWGVRQGIPTLVVAASSMDDVIAITGFGVALAVCLATGKSLTEALLHGPLEAFGGAAFGTAVGSLLCLFPPPKLEHSHLIRGILLMCFAITGLSGSVLLDVAGAGALACLTLAFVVATCWRAGYPWRLTQSELVLDPEDPDSCGSPLFHSSDDEQNRGGPKPSVVSETMTEKAFGRNAFGRGVQKANRRPVTELDTSSLRKISAQDDESVAPDHDPTFKRRQHKESGASSILESLVEYHPYYCSILQQQYRNSMRKEHQGASNRSSMSKKGLKSLHGGDLPALAVAVAATGTERRPSGTTVIPFPVRGTKPRASRRFSLPEPTAHYELESFTVSPAFRRDMGSTSSRSSNQKLSKYRRRILSPNFREQYAAMHSQPVEKLDEKEELEDEYMTQAQKPKETELYAEKESEKNVNAFGSSTAITNGADSLVALPATPQERGLTCLNSMRQTLAAVWWFVQPVLFTLIGAEVNLFRLAGGSTGVGVGCLLIALLVRVAATVMAVLPSKMNMKERLFVGLSWLPKATVQAAVGPVALDTARKLHASPEIIGYGELVLTLAAIAILISAPLGAILIPLTAPYLLQQDLAATQVMVAQTNRRKKPESHPHPAPVQVTKSTTLPPLPERPVGTQSHTLSVNYHSNEELH
ncbi:Sodium/hydrogen exchanger 9B2 [Clonorchis sinensis]|uniref:Sodium/hydrogen exchanger 9B2 n=2 Tax=Clonorchis sinensis TaxID=79923 RepID=A0A3R7GKP3_CLOSI|nr:Sodium/hydrogen exchanger 9B2 [Clonorchis sinensis]